MELIYMAEEKAIKKDIQNNGEMKYVGKSRYNLMEESCSTSRDQDHKICFMKVKSHLFIETKKKGSKGRCTYGLNRGVASVP